MIARSVRIAIAASPSASVVLLVAVNLVPLAGVLFGRWNVATILVLYWVENGIVGLLNVPKMLLASGPVESLPAVPLRETGPPVALLSSGAAKTVLVPFFLLHYGLFWLVHGVFVFGLPMFFASRGQAIDPNTLLDPGVPPAVLPWFSGVTDGPKLGPDLAAVAVGAVGLAVSHTISLVVNYVGRGEFRRVSAARQMFAPYGRLAILHLTILFGAFVSLAIGSPVGAIVVLVLLKTVLDLALHVREHEPAGRSIPG